MEKSPAEEKAQDSRADWQRWEDPQYPEESAVDPRDSTGRFYASPGSHGLSILQGASEAESEGPDFMYEAAPSHRYRFIVALFLAIVIGGLGYKAWKATKGTESTYAPPPPPVSTGDNNPPANAPESASAPQKNDSDASTKSTTASTKSEASTPTQQQAQAAETPTPKAERASNSKEETTDEGQPSTSRGKASAAVRSTAKTSTANGSEELSIAEQYLNGANGRRNGAQAAPWLWKSVGKHNGQASLLLADLYLKGDGVSKNCDQARILLDSAARKGVSGAGDRLRHLAAFGCH